VTPIVKLVSLASLAVKKLEEHIMAWTTPVVSEVCVGMEVTSYSSAEI
jgi:coenzyme PQQ precursor peptide PqqA